MVERQTERHDPESDRHPGDQVVLPANPEGATSARLARGRLERLGVVLHLDGARRFREAAGTASVRGGSGPRRHPAQAENAHRVVLCRRRVGKRRRADRASGPIRSAERGLGALALSSAAAWGVTEGRAPLTEMRAHEATARVVPIG